MGASCLDRGSWGKLSRSAPILTRRREPGCPCSLQGPGEGTRVRGLLQCASWLPLPPPKNRRGRACPARTLESWNLKMSWE